MDNQTLNIKPKNGYGFVYCYTSPSGKKYIGQTKTTLKERAKLKAKGYASCPYFYKAIQKYGLESFEVEILAEVPLDRLSETEIQNILYYDTCNRDKGYNIVIDEVDYLGTINRVHVYSYDENTGQYIGDFISIAEAERQLGAYYGTIRRVVNHPYRSAKGRLWRTENFKFIEIPEKEKQPNAKIIYQYDIKTGEFLCEYPSIRNAATATGFGRSSIQRILQEKTKKTQKYVFRYFKVDNLYDESSTTIPDGSNEE